jgi:hypothetical protein
MDEIMAIYPPAWQAMQPIIEAHQRGVTVTREQAAERAGLSRRTSAPPAPPGPALRRLLVSRKSHEGRCPNSAYPQSQPVSLPLAAYHSVPGVTIGNRSLLASPGHSI